MKKSNNLHVSVGEHWEGFVDGLVEKGRYGSVSEVVRDALRLLEEREAQRAALRRSLADSIAQGGTRTRKQAEARLKTRADELRRKGVGA